MCGIYETSYTSGICDAASVVLLDLSRKHARGELRRGFIVEELAGNQCRRFDYSGISGPPSFM
jgi:hypothetical protein